MKTKRILIAVAVVAILGLCLSRNRTGDAKPALVPAVSEGSLAELPEAVTEKWEPIASLHMDSDGLPLRSGAVSPNGRYLAVSNELAGGLIATTVYDLSTGKNLARIRGRRDSVGAKSDPAYIPFRHGKELPVTFSPDSGKLAFLSSYSIVLWDIVGNKELRRIYLRKKDVKGGEDWRYSANGQEVYELQSLQFSPDGRRIFAAMSTSGRIFDVASGRQIRAFEHPTLERPNNEHIWDYERLTCLPDLSRIFYSTRNDRKRYDEPTRLFVRNTETGRDTERMFNFCEPRSGYLLIRGSHAALLTPQVSPDGQYFATEYAIDLPMVWDANTGSDVCAIPLAHRLTAMTMLAHANILVTVCDPAPKYPPDKRRPDLHAPLRSAPVVPKAIEATHALLEFWNLDELIWDKDRGGLFPRRIRACYLDASIGEVSSLVASPDGALLYVRSAENLVQGDSTLSIAAGYLFPLTDRPPKIPSNMLLDDSVVSKLEESHF